MITPLQVEGASEQETQAKLQKAVVAERLAGLLAKQDRLQAALDRSQTLTATSAQAGVVGASTAELGDDAGLGNGDKKDREGEYSGGKVAAVAKVEAAANLVEDDGLDEELNARRTGGGGFVETERDRLIRTVRPLSICITSSG